MTNATTPFYLVFRETYGNDWKSYINNKPIPNIDHITVNGFANAWYINKTGNYTITLYYTIQTYADITWVISFIALFITIAIGYLGYRDSHETNKVKRFSYKRIKLKNIFSK